MSSSNNAPSPRAPRGKHQHSKSATQVHPPNAGTQAPRRPRGNRRNHANNGDAQQLSGNRPELSANPPPVNVDDAALADSAVFSSEELSIPTGPRNGKKHTHSQPSSDRVFSPTALPPASLTDSEIAPYNPSATPAKAQSAYAGPTFHASPAPSSLPIPKFLSKSVPAKSQAQPGLSTPPDQCSASPPSPTPLPPSPSRAPIPVPTHQENSPLDMLFRADREERARNANHSSASAIFSNSANQPSRNGEGRHIKQDSHSSLSVVFPIEMDGESKASRISPPPVSLVAHRSVAAPSKIPQVEHPASPNSNSNAVQDLLDRLNLSQEKPVASTPPRTADRIPSAPSSRYHTPSPFYDGRSSFRSASGPTTPAPQNQESSDFFYGNRNLSPLFKAAKTEPPKRNSGLRTEITADSPIMLQGGFSALSSSSKMDANTVSRNYLDNVLGPVSPRRGSAPHIEPFREPPNHRKTRTPGRRAYHPRPDSYPYAKGNQNGSLNGNSVTLPKSKTAIPFIPSSVQTKQHSTKSSNPLSLEEELKQLLNLRTGPEAIHSVR
ncbi:uncharacterized protein BDR25DRAFT_120809 [Lindgomyces ingoldianus]|uniref:Uncharacterized protein n=1 Tax=Lindgomyces ingoldianus TaxID=673940 RepID=A0ACB6R638_9PLEO|nr:uncharacterized protein BDR25DRAFT_120809 [Lindgomyces ingoldianus]KAF2474308.1 hypothetical protein BDR25DRAFT_120809 [Lindgomyces ingoldianus]